MRARPERAVRCLSVVVVTLALAGCGGQPPGPNPAEENIRQVAVLVGHYARTHKGKMPSSLDELKKFALNSKDAPFAKVSDDIFTSPRDNQPYVVVPMARMPMPTGDKKTVIVHEKTGVNGRRYVAYELAQVEEVDEATFQQLVPGGKK